MKAIILKELRENLKIMLVGLTVLLILIFAEYRELAWSLKNEFFHPYTGHPLLGDKIVAVLTFFCAIFGTLLGWVQGRNERHRDLWAFLIHRPLTRMQIFSGKILAGLLLYLLMPGIPLLLCVLWVASPGHVPAPFEWPMALPILAAFLVGLVYYFGGMLGALRRARWYGSRYLGQGLAILISIAMMTSWTFHEALAYILAGAGILGAAAWGAFHSDGQDEGQPVFARVALAISLTAGTALVIFIALLISFEAIFRPARASESSYTMAMNGAIYKVVSSNNGRSNPWEPAVDLDGRPVQGTTTNALAENGGPASDESRTSRLGPGAFDDLRLKTGFQSTGRFFTFGGKTETVIWYLWRRYDCLAGYDVKTRRFIGALGPGGFSPNLPVTNFSGSAVLMWQLPGPLLAVGNDFYELDLRHRTVRKFFSSEDGNLLAAAQVLRNSEWDCTVALTERSVILLNRGGKVMWRHPVKRAEGVWVSYIRPPGNFAVWIPETQRTNAYAGFDGPMLVTWFGPQGPERSVKLPALEHPGNELLPPRERVLSSALPPGFWAMLPLIKHESWRAIPREMVRISIITALLCLPVAWWLGWRYRLGFGAKVWWSAFILFGGIPGLLAFLSVKEWPARESCPQCGKPRVVNREQCEHCGVPFAPPPRNGTEIFEPVAANKPPVGTEA